MIPAHVTISASAGSGKTHQLSGRYLALLAEGADPSSILAITFTRASAGEILARVLARLADAAVDHGARDRLSAQVGRPLTIVEVGAMLERLAASLHRVQIMTIDAFIARLARRFGAEVGLPAGFRILDDLEGEAMRIEAVGAALDTLGTRAGTDLLRRLGVRGALVRDAVGQRVADAYSTYIRADGAREPWLVPAGPGVMLGEADLDRASAAVREIPAPIAVSSGKPHANWVKAIARAAASAERRAWEALLDNTLAMAVLKGHASYSSAPIDPQATAGLRSLVRHAASRVADSIRDRNGAAHEFLGAFHDASVRLKRAAGGYRFDDLTRALRQAGLMNSLDHVYYRLDASIAHVLIDEFQDTSVDQFLVIAPLIDEIAAWHDGSRTVLCVGDVKQSLYGWRGGEPGLLDAIPLRWDTFTRTELDTNYRSSQVVLDAVNSTFSTGKPEPTFEDLGAVNEFGSTFRAHTSGHPGLPGLVRVRAHAEGRPLAGHASAGAADAAARLARELPGASVAVLVRKNWPIAHILHHLRRLGVEASEDRGNPLTDTPACAVALSLLQLADRPGDSAAAYHVATSPVGAMVGLTDWRSAAQRFDIGRSVRDRLAEAGYARTLEAWLRDWAPVMDRHSARRFAQMVALGATFGTRSQRPGDFVRLVRAEKVEVPGGSRVRVMTVHGAKGLEFDAVVLAHLDEAWSIDSNSILTSRSDREGGLASALSPVTFASTYLKRALWDIDDDLKRAGEQTLRARFREELCTLYVAMTRAIHVLEIVIRPDGQPGARPEKQNAGAPSSAKLIRHRLRISGPIGPGDVAYEDGDVSPIAAAIERRTRAGAVPPQEPRAISWRPSAVPASAVPLRRTSPSMISRTARPVREIFSPGEGRGAAIGSLVHSWFERIEWLDPGAAAESVVPREPTPGMSEADADRARAMFRASIEGRSGAILHRAHYEPRLGSGDLLEVRREVAYAVRDPIDPGAIQAGRIDRLVVCRRAGRPVWAEVIDFRADGVPMGEVEARAAHHAPQIEAYRKGAAAALGLDLASIGAVIVFVAPDAVVRVGG